MINFLHKNWKMILLAIAGIIIGVLGNMYANRLSEKRIIDALTAEIEALHNKQKTGRITSEEQKRISDLQAQLKFLTQTKYKSVAY